MRRKRSKFRSRPVDRVLARPRKSLRKRFVIGAQHRELGSRRRPVRRVVRRHVKNALLPARKLNVRRRAALVPPQRQVKAISICKQRERSRTRRALFGYKATVPHAKQKLAKGNGGSRFNINC